MFQLDPDAWHRHASESLWAEPIGQGRYRLMNAPFFAKGVSYGDVVHAPEGEDGLPKFEKVESRGGYSTCRIVTKQTNEDRAEFVSNIEKLEKFGCEYERGEVGDTAIYALNVPPESDIGKVYEVLDAGQKIDVWDWETGFDGHPPDPE